MSILGALKDLKDAAIDAPKVNGKPIFRREEKTNLPPVVDKERDEVVKKLVNDPNVKNEEAYYNKTYGPNTAAAGQGLIKMYIDRAGQKGAKPVSEQEVKEYLDTTAVKNKDGVNLPLTDQEKKGAREMTWGAFSQMKGLIKDQGLDSKYKEVVVNGPVPVEGKKDEFTKISVLGPKK